MPQDAPPENRGHYTTPETPPAQGAQRQPRPYRTWLQARTHPDKAPPATPLPLRYTEPG